MGEYDEYKMLINGKYIEGSAPDLQDNRNPSTGGIYAKMHHATTEDATKAIDAAEAAFQTWKDHLPKQREQILLKAANLIEERVNELSTILIEESGSAFGKAFFEVFETADLLRSAAGESRRVMGQTFPTNFPGVFSYSIRKPLGIVTAISPFNFPLLLTARKVGWALAAGNCVVLKPSDYTPVIALKLGQVFLDAGLPAGVLNVVVGRGSVVGNALIDDPRVRFVSFTGSTEVGRQVGVRCAMGNKRYTLEMGGKNPIIVLDDADVDYAVDAAAFSNYVNQGQVCLCGSRIIVEQGIYDEFCEKFSQKVSGLKMGAPHEQDTIVGPLVDPAQSPFIKKLLDSAVAKGARILTGGNYKDAFFEPTVIVDVTPEMEFFRIEAFGPAAAVTKAKDYLHAVELANDTNYGLSSAVFTKDLEKALYVSENIEAGMCHVNGPSIREEGTIPFGGVKDSGLGREGGHFSIEELTELKWVTVQKGHQFFPF